MSSAHTNLPPLIREKLLGFERRRRLLVVLRGLAETVLVFGCGLAVVVLIEWLIKTHHPARVWLSILNYAVTAGCFVWRVVWPLTRRRALPEIARHYENAAGGKFHERILSAVEMAAGPVAVSPGISSWMVRQTIELAERDLRTAEVGVDARPAHRAWKFAGATVLVLLLAGLLPGIRGRLALAVSPQASTEVLSRIKLSVTPGNLRVRQGSPVELRLQASEPVKQAQVIIAWDDGYRETVPLSPSGTNQFNVTLAALTQGFQYRVEADDAQSARFQVRVDVPPRLARLQMHVEPPAYTQRSNAVVEGGTVDFLEGSRLRLVAETTGERVRSAEWRPDAGPGRPMKVEPGKALFEAQPTNSLSYQLFLLGENGLPAESQRKWQWRLVPDAPPLVRLQTAAAEARLVESDEVLRFEVEASDDVGLKSVQLLAIKGETEADFRQLLETGPGNLPTRHFKQGLNYSLSDLTAVIGEEVQFEIIATDLKNQVTRSEPVSIVIGSLEKKLQAQLAARLKRLISGLESQAGQLQQTRSSWLSLARNHRAGEGQAEQPALVLLRSRLDEFSREIAAIGAALVAESETNAVQDARFMYRLGTTFNAWSEQQRNVLLGTCARLNAPDLGTNSFQVFNQGRELFSRAITDLEEYGRVLKVLGGALDTEVLAAQSESARGRYKRALPVLRGEAPPASPGDATGPGLMATFFEGTALGGSVLEQKVTNPRTENYAPAGRASNWSCRYEGDLEVTQAGEWVLGCIADDGVRLFVNGKNILPDYAWSPHSPTEYKAEVTLATGWHAVRIEFFQGEGTSKLQLMAGRKGQNWQEVREEQLRPPAARQPKKDSIVNPALAEVVKSGLRDRVRASMEQTAGVPPAVSPLTNIVRNDHLFHLVEEKIPVGQSLTTNLLQFAAWTPDDTRKAETQSDDLAAFSRSVANIMRQELEKVRWRYEGAEALKKVQNAITELREIQQEIARMPNHSRQTRTELEQVRIETARVWQEELERAAAQAAHDFFETARAKDATLAERTLAMNAANKAEAELTPAIRKLATTLDKNGKASQIASEMDQRLNEVNDRFRELNDLQERMNREHIAAEARQALAPARALARAQSANNPADAQEAYQPLSEAVEKVQKAQRKAGEYNQAQRLESLAGDAPAEAKGKELAAELRNLALQTDNNPPSLAQSIPPPIQNESKELQSGATDAQQAANELAKPRLAMSLEASRLARQRDSRAAAAYDLLGQDLGAMLQKPAELTPQGLKPIHERAAALAGMRGEQARQKELDAAAERLKALAQNQAQEAPALASQLERLSTDAKEAAGNAPRQEPLQQELRAVAAMAPAVSDYADSADPAEIAASAASESLAGIESAPKAWESYQQASEILADAARQLRMDAALAQIDDLEPYAAPEPSALAESGPATQSPGPMDGDAGRAITAPPPPGLDQAEWARLNERLRQAIRTSGIENFTEEQQSAIRAYFERLSSQD